MSRSYKNSDRQLLCDRDTDSYYMVNRASDEHLMTMAFVDPAQVPLLAGMVVLKFSALSSIALRVWARGRGGTKLWWDDWILIVLTVRLSRLATTTSAFTDGAEFVALIPEFAIEIVVIHLGTGLHIGEVLSTQPENLALLSKLSYVDTLSYAVIIGPCKCSFLLLYIRLFGIRKKFTLWCYTLIGVTVVWAIITFFVEAFQCNPVENAWGASREGCMNFQYIFIGTNVPNVLIDVLILVTPLHAIWSLKVPLMKKLIINAILAVGTM